MRFGMHIVAAGVLLAALAGCGIEGHWSKMRAVPDAATDFRIIEMTLRGDNTFEADYERGGAVMTMDGTYTYNSDTKVLTLSMRDGEVRNYHAELSPKDKDVLYVWNAQGPKVWEVTLERN